MASSATPLRHWLSLRVRLACLFALLVGSLLPPYIPKTALALDDVSAVEQEFLLVEDGFLMKSSMLTNYGARRAYTKGRVHVVKEGESVEKLANRYNLKPDTIRWANDLDAGDTIHPGQELVILPVNGVLHEVTRGQTLSRIAELYQVDPKEIMSRNNLQSEFILAGQELIIPGASPIVGSPTVIASADLPVQKPTGSEKPTTDQKPAQEKPKPQTAVQEDVFPTSTETSTEIAEADITTGVLQKPCSAACFITQYYHSGHFALDMQERGGGNVYAAEAGTVIRADTGWNGGYGNVIEIDHGNGLITLYGHNKKFHVKEGDRVQRGQKIADMGNTGLVYGATGIHVHFEVHLKGVKKNPLLYIQ